MKDGKGVEYSPLLGYIELPHPEALALWDSCKKALGLNCETGEKV